MCGPALEAGAGSVAAEGRLHSLGAVTTEDTGMAWSGPLGAVVLIGRRGLSDGAGGLVQSLFLSWSSKDQDSRVMV